MNSLTQQDLQFVVRRIPRDVRDLLMSGTFFLGGGFIRETIAGGQVQDIDVFGQTKGQLLDAVDLFAKMRQVKAHATDNAITVLSPPRLPVQFITRWVFSEAEPLVKSFDFTVCQAVVWFQKGSPGQWMSMASDGFYPDLAARRLVYTAPEREEEAGGSMMRVRKFLGRGYNIQATSLGAVMARVVSKVQYRDGMTEHERGQVIAGLLHEVDPLLVVDGLEPINEHEVL